MMMKYVLFTYNARKRFNMATELSRPEAKRGH